MTIEVRREDDGKTHINIYSQALTLLGRLLSHFTETPFCVPDDGCFKCVEGYWYWLGCSHFDRDRLREYVGFAAKKEGRAMRAPDWPKDEVTFRQKIEAAERAKTRAHKEIRDLLIISTLPFEHYYVDKKTGNVILVKEGRWILDIWECIRMELKSGIFI